MAKQTINTTGRDVKDHDHVWWDEQTATYIITVSGTRVPADYPQAAWLGRMENSVRADVWLALERSERTI